MVKTDLEMLESAYNAGLRSVETNKQIDYLLADGTKQCPERPSFKQWMEDINVLSSPSPSIPSISDSEIEKEYPEYDSHGYYWDENIDKREGAKWMRSELAKKGDAKC